MTQHLADHPEHATGPDTVRTHRLAVLALVFAIVVPPAGIVLAVLALRQSQLDRPDRRLALGALVLAVLVLIGELWLLIALTTFGSSTSSTSTDRSSGSAAASSSAAAASSSAAGGSADSTTPGAAAADPKGVVTACDVVVPALGQVRSDVGKAKTADQYGQVLSELANNLVTAAGATTDPTFLRDVRQLSLAFQKGVQESSDGKAPSAVADELTAAGAAVNRDFTAAGYHP